MKSHLPIRKMIKSQSPISGGGGGGGGEVVGDQLPTFDAESKFAKIPMLIYSGGFGDQLPTFDAESKSA